MSNFKWQNITILNSRNQRLDGIFYTKEDPAATTLIVCHGFTGTKEGGGKALDMAKHFSESGIETLLFDFSGNGKSEGNFSEITLSNHIDDLKWVVNWCRQVKSGPIITLGRSFGGCAVIAHAATDTSIDGVCTWATPAELRPLFWGLAVEDPMESSLVHLENEEGTVLLKSEFFRDIVHYNLTEAVGLISPRPILFIHGTEDETVPPDDGKKLYDAAYDPKMLRYIPQANHRFQDTYQDVWSVCLEWLNLHFM